MYEIKLEIKTDNELLYVYDTIQAGIDKYGVDQVKNDAPGLYAVYEKLRFMYPEAFKKSFSNDHFFMSLQGNTGR
jgi:hypothetical protein